ncbi:MAG: hypothetical protein AAGH78_09785 [Cyanobacteria bacterium P01_H01_bin.58]
MSLFASTFTVLADVAKLERSLRLPAKLSANCLSLWGLSMNLSTC